MDIGRKATLQVLGGEEVADMSNKGSSRRIFLLPHPEREDAWLAASNFVRQVATHGIECVASDADSDRLLSDFELSLAAQKDSRDCSLIVTFGGDGTILRAADLARDYGTPILGVNLGHVGFLAEAEVDAFDSLVQAVVNEDYTLETRDTLTLIIHHADGSKEQSWALNEVALEKGTHTNMLDLFLAIDNQPVSSWSCDGVVCATPTGSTAYAWSAGGPVVWPDVEAIVVAPISAHALFSRPMVVGPAATISFELSDRSKPGIAACDGRRIFDIASGDRVEIARSQEPVVFARLHRVPFADRLVRKFELPISGWRGVR